MYINDLQLERPFVDGRKLCVKSNVFRLSYDQHHHSSLLNDQDPLSPLFHCMPSIILPEMIKIPNLPWSECDCSVDPKRANEDLPIPRVLVHNREYRNLLDFVSS